MPNHLTTQNLLHEGIKTKNLAQIRTAVREGADPNLQMGKEAMTPLHSAAGLHGDRDLVQCLLDEGANPNLQNYNGETPLHWAVLLEEHLPVVQCLLEGGAHATLQDRTRETPIHIVACKGHLAMLQCLVTQSSIPDLELENDCKKTAFDLAKDRAQTDVMQYLAGVPKERFLCFALGRHARAGENSPVGMLPEDMMGLIYKHTVKP